MFLIVLAAGSASVADARVIDTLVGEEFSRFGISGQILERPAGVDDREFAVQIMEAEGLTPWNGQPFDTPPRDGSMGTAAIIAGNGHEINVKYVAGDRSRPGRICRLRFQPGVGASQERWNAYRWCAAAFGLSLPATFPPPAIAVVDAAWPTVSGDFDRDGLEDRAYFRELAGHDLVVERGVGRMSVVAPVSDPSDFYLGVLAPGTYQTACGKGFGSRDAPCPERSVTLDRPALQFGTKEASQAVAIWDGDRFRVVWLSD